MIGSTKPVLGRLERVELREAWAGEASDFTPWLAQTDNIILLGEAIGIELEVESQEKHVGPFRADILCRRAAMCAEVLVPGMVPARHIMGAYVQNEAAVNSVRSVAPHLLVEINADLFFG
jgi:hypothetical protein